MSKVDDILNDELDPEDLDPTPRGGKSGRKTSSDGDTSTTPRFVPALVALLLLALAGCKDIDSVPSTPTAAVSCEQPSSACQGGEIK